MTSADTTFKKPNSALVLMPKIGKLTAITRKLFNVLLNVTQRQVAQCRKNGMVVPIRFKARLSDLVDLVEVGESNLLSQSKKSFREMRRVELDWEAPDANSGVIFTSMSLLSQVTFTKEGGKGVIYAEWAFPPDLMEVIKDPSRYTPINIAQLVKLKSYTAVALYEIASRYKINPTGKTSENDMDWWISALSQSAAPIDAATKLPKQRGWSKFKDDSLNAAIKEINLKTDLSVELLEKKTGRKLTSAQFRVSSNIVDNSSDLDAFSKMSPEIAKMATKLGLSLGDISNLISKGQNENVLEVAFSKLELRLAREDLVTVDSKIAYLRSVLTDTNKFVFDKPPMPVHHVKNAPPPTLEKEPVTPQSYKELRRSEIKDELMNLGKDQQKPYAEIALEALRVAGLSTPSTKRKVEAGNWAASPFLLSKMVEIYAVDIHGPEWFNGSAKEA